MMLTDRPCTVVTWAAAVLATVRVLRVLEASKPELLVLAEAAGYGELRCAAAGVRSQLLVASRV